MTFFFAEHLFTAVEILDINLEEKILRRYVNEPFVPLLGTQEHFAGKLFMLPDL